MAKVLILCPTFDHADTLFASIASVRIQRFTDWELVVIGDGAPERTYTVLDTIVPRDSRIHYVRHPKAARHGEEYRDPIIRGSNAEFVCHLNDDDLWAPDHLDAMIGLLQRAEWVNESPLRLEADGRSEWWLVNSGTTHAKNAVETLRQVTAGINYVGYRREAYLRLDEGWTPTPKEAGPTDQFMWRKFLRLDKLTIASTARSSALKLASSTPARQRLRPEQRMAELAPWLARMSEPGLMQAQCRAANVGNRLARVFAIHEAQECATVEAAFARSGMRPAGERADPRPGLNGAAMTVPLTRRQRTEAWRSWAMLRCYGGPGGARLKRKLAESFAGNINAWRDAIAALGWDRPDAAAEAARDFRDATDRSPQSVVLSAALALQAGDLELLDGLVSEMQKRWPDMPATKDMAERLKRVYQPVASPKE